MTHPTADASDAPRRGNALSTLALVAIAATLGYSLGWQRGIGPPGVQLRPLVAPDTELTLQPADDAAGPDEEALAPVNAAMSEPRASATD